MNFLPDKGGSGKRTVPLTYTCYRKSIIAYVSSLLINAPLINNERTPTVLFTVPYPTNSQISTANRDNGIIAIRRFFYKRFSSRLISSGTMGFSRSCNSTFPLQNSDYLYLAPRKILSAVQTRRDILFFCVRPESDKPIHRKNRG